MYSTEAPYPATLPTNEWEVLLAVFCPKIL
jgi:hypothetical protein